MEYFQVCTLPASCLFFIVEEELFPKKRMLMTVCIESWNFRYQRRKILFKPLIWSREPSK